MELKEKIFKAAKCCCPRYGCSRCPYRRESDCYRSFIEDIVKYFTEVKQ